MQAAALATQDRVWLNQHSEACRLKCDFIMQDIFHPGSPAAVEAARSVLIWLGDGYAMASETAHQIEQDTPYSQIFEQWEYRRYQGVLAHAAKLSEIDGRALIVAAGFGDACEDDLYSTASEAVMEARRELYGDEA